MNYIYIGNQNNSYKVLKFCILSLTGTDQKEKDESQQSTKDFGKKNRAFRLPKCGTNQTHSGLKKKSFFLYGSKTYAIVFKPAEKSKTKSNYYYFAQT